MQQVCVNGIVSNWIELKQCVPQETVYGRLLFKFQIIDLPEQLGEPAKLLQYVDDCFFSF